MQITFVSDRTQETIKNLLALDNLPKTDLYLFGSSKTVSVDYAEELSGKTRLFEDIALLSKKQACVVAFLATTSTKGHLRKSVIMAEKGKLIGVSDMTRSLERSMSVGAYLQNYATGQGKIGVIVGEDLYFPNRAQALADCGADYLLCLTDKTDNSHTAIVQAYAKCFSLPVIYCADGKSGLANEKGELVFSSPSSPVAFSVQPRKEYKLAQMRIRRR
jgi:predicted amidohydrolase